jgi:predicted transcriptional regulator
MEQAQMDKNNIKIIQALASIQPKYVGIDNTQITDSNGRDRNVMIHQAIAKLEQENQDLATQLASYSTNYSGLANTQITDSNGRDRTAHIVTALADSEARALALLAEMNVSTGQHYVGIDNTQTTDSNGRDRNVMIQEGITAVSQKIVGCYDADHPRTCNIGSGANYTQYAP